MNKTMLIVLDGLGLNPIEKGNPIFKSRTPFLDQLILNSSHLNLSASAESVGLSWGEVGNSEVGHSNLGTGQIIWQDLPRIDQQINDGSFEKNKIVLEAIKYALKNNSSLHLLGLISDGGIHSHLRHLFALLEIAKKHGLRDVFIHGFTDGRDTAPKLAKKFIRQIEKITARLKLGKISTLSGRFYAMDRDDHWHRIKLVYEAINGQSSHTAKSALAAIDYGYAKKLSDENLEPVIIGLGNKKQFLSDNDAVIIFNFRADRAREITISIAEDNFVHFERKEHPKNIFLATMTPYETDWKIKIKTIFGLLQYQSPLADIISQKKLKQLHIAETEKYAHVTYFFNGGREEELEGEKYVCIPSPRVSDYASVPEMSLNQVTSELLAGLSGSNFDFVLVNFANPDMVGHTGDFKAAVKALDSVDKNLGFLIAKAIKLNYNILISADHGNIEQMVNLENGEIDKEHTTNPVFLIKVNQMPKPVDLSSLDHRKIWSELPLEQPKGVLADLTPTIAKLLGIVEPDYFSGQNLLNLL